MFAVKRGDIFHRYFTTTTPPKSKFFVIVGEGETHYVGYFFINSNVNSFVARNSEMMNMQVPIKPANYPFLNHLSFIAGHQLAKIKKSDLIKELSAGVAQYKGRMDEEDMKMLLNAALESPLFSKQEKRYFK